MQTRLLGQRRLDARLATAAAATHADRSVGLVVDVGGGPARSRAMWPASFRYVCVDPDRRHITRDAPKSGEVERIVGSADRLPFPDGSADVVLMQCVSHHLGDDLWPAALEEIARVLKPDGDFVFLDAVWSSRRLVSRALWRLDAGDHPRSRAELLAELDTCFDVTTVDDFTLAHRAILVTAGRRDRRLVAGDES